ncbi:hypothetical protein A2U01_0044254, partial [Trifolium medium]|nr:hypothetical protein [Trifolium medium]
TIVFSEKEAGRSLGAKASVLWNEWCEMQLVRTSSVNIMQVQQQPVVQQWQKPPIGWYKCNVDAGFHILR